MHAAQCRRVQRRYHRLRREKIWRHDLHAGLGAAQRAEDRPGQLLEVFIRSVRDAAGDDFADGFEGREPGVAAQGFAGAEQPIINKRLLEVRDDRAFDAEVQILDRMFRIGLETIPWRRLMPPVKRSGRRSRGFCDGSACSAPPGAKG